MVLCFYSSRSHSSTLHGAIVLASCYILYIADTMPHTENIFNRLELFNEFAFIVVAYTFIGYSGTDIDPILNATTQYKLGQLSVCLIGVAYFGNLIAMIVIF